NGFLQNEMIDVGEGAVPVFFDADSDGLKDLIIGNVNRTDSGSVVQHSLSYFRNTGTLTQPSFEFVTDDYAGISSYPISGPLFPTFGDLDGDGDMDLLLGHEVGELYYFENTAGVGLPANFVFTTPNYFNIDIGNSSAPQIIDLNRDGKQDLVIGKKSGIIAYFENIGSISIPFFSSVPTKDTLGGINVQTIGFVDGFSVPYIYEDSAEYKMLVACMRGDIYSYDGIEGNVLGNYIKQDTLISRYQGVKTTFNLSVSGGDINGDNQIDMLVGLYGGGLQIYLRDTLTSSISKVERTPLFNVFPNPANASFKIVADKMSIDRSSRLRIADVSGRILYDELFSGIEDVISTSEFSTGLYFVSLSNGVFVTTRRLTVLR
ncbi:MAG: T9SS type A sorting domain-containing protein, partial [Bacteroidia bacterium]|nr:T9SS type A sorting domain-containing protein [Bacteroidia bacterium]